VATQYNLAAMKGRVGVSVNVSVSLQGARGLEAGGLLDAVMEGTGQHNKPTTASADTLSPNDDDDNIDDVVVTACLRWCDCGC
jgi:hypothetical protein